MPLFELFRAAKGKPSASNEKPTSTSADPSPPHENELVELIWENGQVMMQGQSSRARKNPSPYNTYNLPSYSLPSHSPERGKDLSCAPHSSSSVKVRTSDSGLNEFPTSVPLGEMCLSSDDDIVPWFDYPIDESLRNDYCSDFLSELSGVTAKEPSQNDFDTMKRDGCINHVYRDSNENSIHNGLNLDHGNTTKSSSPAVVSEAMRHETCRGPAEQSQFPSLRPRHVSENTGTSTSNHCVGRDLSQVTNSAAEFSCEKLRKQNPGHSINRNELQNFAHFSRPAVFCKSAGGKKIDDSGPSSSERAHFKLKDSSPDVKIVQSNSGQIGEMRSHGQFAVEKEVNDSRSLEAKPTEEPPSKESEGNRQERAAKDDKLRNESGGTSMSKEPQDAVEPVVASSICSGNGVDSASDDPASNLKRKGRINYDSEAPSDDVEEDSVGLRKSAPARGSSSKRSRSAEVHNLSERRRRDRINEKMRALQELIPNCNKVDKASMLDEAIDYLKTLQLQVQMMSMGAGLYMPPIMLPAHMAQFPPMGLGMAAGLGFRMGMVEPNGVPTACPMLRVPPMQGAHFPSPIMPGHQALHGMAGPNFPIIGLPSQVLPLSVPYMAPLVPSPGGHPLVPPGLNANVAKGHTENADAAFASSSKEATENINGASCSMKNHIPGQCQARNSVEQPEDRAVSSSTAPRDVTRPSTATSEDKLV